MKIRIDPADRAFSIWIRARDEHTCKRCGGPGGQASHFIGRAKENTRFDPLNVDTLCFGCHNYFHGQPSEHYDWQVKTKGQTVVDRLKFAAHQYHKKDRASEFLYWQIQLLKDFNIVVDEKGKQV